MIALPRTVVDAQKPETQGILLHPDGVSDGDLTENAVLLFFKIGVDQLGHIDRRVGLNGERDVERADRPARIGPCGRKRGCADDESDEQASPGATLL